MDQWRLFRVIPALFTSLQKQVLIQFFSLVPCVTYPIDLHLPFLKNNKSMQNIKRTKRDLFYWKWLSLLLFFVFFILILFISCTVYTITQGLESTIVCKKRAAWRRVVGCEPGTGGRGAACFDSISPLLLLQFTLLLLLYLVSCLLRLHRITSIAYNYTNTHITNYN